MALTGFSRGMNLGNALDDRVHGGECLDGLKIAIYIRGMLVILLLLSFEAKCH